MLRPELQQVVDRYVVGHEEELPGHQRQSRAAVRVRRFRRRVLSEQRGKIRPADRRLVVLPEHDHPPEVLPRLRRR